MKNAEISKPYNGAKPHYVLDIEDDKLLKKVIPIVEQTTEIPKTKKKKIYQCN